mmetsp:Transcript_38965/g.85019  ORF Transcript_38965/g.85019 Transcript_38965/m.85019 type:complete len:294 (+) Transcript_38965:111-992(+)
MRLDDLSVSIVQRLVPLAFTILLLVPLDIQANRTIVFQMSPHLVLDENNDKRETCHRNPSTSRLQQGWGDGSTHSLGDRLQSPPNKSTIEATQKCAYLLENVVQTQITFPDVILKQSLCCRCLRPQVLQLREHLVREGPDMGRETLIVTLPLCDIARFQVKRVAPEPRRPRLQQLLFLLGIPQSMLDEDRLRDDEVLRRMRRVDHHCIAACPVQKLVFSGSCDKICIGIQAENRTRTRRNGACSIVSKKGRHVQLVNSTRVQRELSVELKIPTPVLGQSTQPVVFGVVQNLGS